MADTAPVVPSGGTEPIGATVVQSESLSSIAWKQFRKHPLARVSLAILGVLYLLAAFADFLAPYPERYIDPGATFQPPNRVHFWNEGRFASPFFYPKEQALDFYHSYVLHESIAAAASGGCS